MGEKVLSIFPAQVRAARAWLYWSQEDLAKAAGISPQAVNRFENSTEAPDPGPALRLRTALEAAGIEFRFDGARPSGIRGPTEHRRRLKRKYRHLDGDPG
jgi:transcriptional regulator with XRE-family HTH domain